VHKLTRETNRAQGQLNNTRAKRYVKVWRKKTSSKYAQVIMGGTENENDTDQWMQIQVKEDVKKWLQHSYIGRVHNTNKSYIGRI